MRIRRFRDEDATAIARIIRRCLDLLGDHYSHDELSFMRAAYTPKRLIEKAARGPMLVALVKDRVVGVARLEGDVVSTVYVDPDVHLEGIGSRLLTRIEGLAKERGCAKLAVESIVSAEGFYEGHGYVRTRRIRSDEYGTMIAMEKRF